MISCSGEQTDRYNFLNYTMRNLQLLEYRNGFEPDVKSTARFVRTEMGVTLRKAPH